MSWFFTPRGNNGNNANVNSDGSLYVVDMAPTGSHYAVAAKTGIVGAAAAAGASVFAMRLNPGYAGKAYIEVVKLRFTTIAAFTTPVTQTRSIVITRGAGAATSGGTAIATVAKKDTSYGASNFESAVGGDTRIASTGALTVTGITFETVNQAEVTLAHVGAAGAFFEAVHEWENRAHPLELNAGELMAVRVGPSAMDAAGTWSLGIEVQWRESASEA